jgi:hypothetical protein
MIEIPHRYNNWGKVVTTAALLPLGMALVTAISKPAAAQSTIIIDGGYNYPNNGYYYPPSPSQQPTGSPFVYGSPIPTPVPVDPNTGLTPRNNNTYSYPVDPNPLGNRVQNSTIVNPVLVNPKIRDSTIVNPVIVDSPRRRERGLVIIESEPYQIPGAGYPRSR